MPKTLLIGELVVIDFSMSYEKGKEANIFVGRIEDVIIYDINDRDKFHQENPNTPFPLSNKALRYKVKSKTPYDDELKVRYIAPSNIKRYRESRHAHLLKKSGAV